MNVTIRKILFYPVGHPTLGFTPLEDTMSVYLARIPSTETETDEMPDSYAHYALAVSNCEDPTLFITSHAYHRFTRSDIDFGFTYFDSKKRLLASRSIVLETRFQVSVYLRAFTKAWQESNSSSENTRPLRSGDVQKSPASVRDASTFVAESLSDPIQDLQSSTLRIDSWRKVSGAILRGEELECGGLKWVLEVHPQGYNAILKANVAVSDLGIYLRCLNPPERGCCAQHMFAISNINDPAVYHM
ncbi:hypothetical protein PM082_004081 [Marasmius tenuissimus]|nr:hypothetical protein PM082_004081 [Marasmius tenuissimus]